MIPRYTRPEMAAIWASERRYRIWLEVELAAAEAMVEQRLIPAGDWQAPQQSWSACAFTPADVARLEDIEKTVEHAVSAFLTFLEERGGAAARQLRRGMTSSDVLGTSRAVQLREASALLLAGVDRVRAAVRRLAESHRKTPMIGRSHG